MRVLVAHNRYRSLQPSGENRVVDEEIELLRSAGVEVIPMIEDSDSLAQASPLAMSKAAIGPVFAPDGVARFNRLLRDTKPQLVHVHNVYPLISPWVIREAHRASVPVVQTVHNYRHTCVGGMHLRNDTVCELCTDRRLSLPAIKYKCYRSSRVQSTAMAAGKALHRGTWHQVDIFLALTSFMASRLVAFGIPEEKIRVRPTAVSDPGEPSVPGRRVLFLGRLERAKGIDILLNAWPHSGLATKGWSLAIAGSGPEESLVRSRCSSHAGIEYLGTLNRQQLAIEYARAGVVALPSTWFEGYPRVVSEALSFGRPIIASDIGGLASIVTDDIGWRVQPGLENWIRCLAELDRAPLSSLSKNARAHWKAHLTQDTSLSTLLRAYSDLVGPT